jgi:transcriptional regulator with XRE-family HTH domain
MRQERHAFGPALRTARERRGVTLEQIAAETNLGVELWAGLEKNDFSRWPKQIYARSYIRDYATRIGLDADKVVNEFCRLFPEWGDRRAERSMRNHAEIVSHKLEWEDLLSAEPRRATDHVAGASLGFIGQYRTLVAVIVDLGAILGLAAAGVLLHFAFWPSLAVAATIYVVVGTAVIGRSLGPLVSEWAIKAAKALPPPNFFHGSKA